jgi:hypothetical protein
MMRSANGRALLVALACAAPAATAADQVHVTVYNNDLALVKDQRKVEIASGAGEFVFTGVPAMIDPTSVRFDAGQGLTILEQNFRYDLVSREKLLERYLDKNVKILTKHDKFHEGVLKTAAGSVVLLTEKGVVVLNEDEIADISLPEIPEGLMTRPALVWRVENSGSKSRDVEIAYLTGGMSWHAEYVATVDAKDTKMGLSGWVSIENNSGGRYENARLKVVAGDVHRVQEMPIPVGGVMRDMAMAEKAPQFEERAFFEYHIYDLQRPATIADREVKQIQLFPDREVPIRKTYVYEASKANDKIQVKVEFENKKDHGLGMPLPGGKFRVYREDADGALEFAGEDRIDHTARDEKVSVVLGNAFDLVGEWAEKESRRVSERVFERSIEIKLRNRKENEAVTILVREHPPGDWKVLDSSHEWKKPKAHDLEFEIPVKAGQEVILTYKVRSEI